MTIAGDGLGLISYYDWNTEEIKLAHCLDEECDRITVSTLDTVGKYGGPSSILAGRDGLGLVSYYDNEGGTDFFANTKAVVKVAHCSNVDCSEATVTVIGEVGATGGESDIKVGADGLGIVSYFDLTDRAEPMLKVAHCSNTECSEASVSSISMIQVYDFDAPMSSAIAVGSDGLALVSYLDSVGLHVAKCDDVKCSSATVSTLDERSRFKRGSQTSLTIGADGFGLIAYHHRIRGTADSQPPGELRVAHCQDTRCSRATITSLDRGDGYAGQYTSIARRSDGLGVIAYSGDDKVGVVYCRDSACTSAEIGALPDPGDYVSVVVGDDGPVRVTYHDYWTGALKLATLHQGPANHRIP